MYSALMLLLCALDLALLAWTFRAWRATGHPVLALLTFLVLALPYDTALVGLGRFIGQGDLLALLSGPRFLFFNLSLPLTLILATGLARMAGVPWLQPKWVIGAVCLVAAALIAMDWRAILQAPELYPACWRDTLRYVPSVLPEQACAAGQAGIGAPFAFPKVALAALPLLLVSGGLVWWRARWPWLFLGTVAAIVFLGLPARLVGPIPGFFGDALNMVAATATAVRLAARRRPAGSLA
jgi:hypothetical protein